MKPRGKGKGSVLDKATSRLDLRSETAIAAMPRDGPAVEWRVTDERVEYPEAVAAMEARVAEIAAGTAPELVWLLEHPPLYTAGTSAKAGDLLAGDRFPVFRSGRGGQYTYHGPGQRVAYVMLDLNRRKRDIRLFVAALEEWIIRTLASFNVRGERRDDRVGIWVPRPEKGLGREDKIAAIGIRIRRWVTFHGIALNIDPVLDHFSGIVPCGIREQGVTSLADLGVLAAMPEVDGELRHAFESVFGPIRMNGTEDLQAVQETAPPGPARSFKPDDPLRGEQAEFNQRLFWPQTP